jgi:hypothetical protein
LILFHIYHVDADPAAKASEPAAAMASDLAR